MKKKTMALPMLAGLAAAFLACPAAAEGTSPVDRLLAQFAAILDCREQIYALQEEVYQAVDDFCEKNDYASLVRARLVCDEASRTMEEISCPELTLSQEELLELMRMGVETDAIEAELQELLQILRNTNEGAYYENLLYTDVYLLSQTEVLTRMVSLSRGIQEEMLTYSGSMVNYLLNPISGEPGVMEFWETIPENWPVVGAGLPEWEENAGKIELRTAATLAAYEELISEYSQLVGEDLYSFEQYAARVEAADLEGLRSDTNVIEGMPVMLPLPSGWMTPERTSIYSSYDEGSEGDAMPSTLIFMEQGVDEEAFQQYLTELDAVGAYLYQLEGSEEEGWEAAVLASDSLLVLHWNPDGSAVAAYDPNELSLEAYLYIVCVL